MADQVKCYLCGCDKYEVIHHGVREAGNINVLKCRRCGLVRLSEFIENVNEFYVNSGMREKEQINIRAIRAEAYADDHRRYQMTKSSLVNKKIMDFGCGAGGYLLEASAIADKVYGVELETAMREKLKSEGIDCYTDVQEAKASIGKVDIITMWHVLEHLPDPISILEQIKSILSKNGKLFIEVPNADDALLSLYGAKEFADFTYWRCHLYLYNNKNLRALLEKAGFKVIFMTQIQRYPLSNTLYWLSKGKPGGHEKWLMLNDDELHKHWEKQLARLGIADTIVAVAEVN